MNKSPIDDTILIRYLEKEISTSDQLMVEEWISISNDNKTYFLELSKLWKASNNQNVYHSVDVEKGWHAVQTRIDQLKPRKSTKKLTSTLLWKIAAGFILLLTLSLYTYTATNPQIITLTTANSVEKFELPDGSLVWLNKNSQLTFKETFSENFRMLKLKGEGYFEVQKNPSKPFIVELNNTKTEVLGTQFSIEEKTDTSVALVLVEGSVRFSTEKESSIVAPGEKISATKLGRLSKHKNLDLNHISWKTKTLKFNETPLYKAIEDIGELYQITFNIENKELLNCNLTLRFENEPLENVLETLQILFDIEYKKTQNSYRVIGGKC